MATKIYCANPQCSDREIKEGPVMYEKDRRNLTHPGMCQQFYGAHLAMITKKPQMFQFEEISLEEAIRRQESAPTFKTVATVTKNK